MNLICSSILILRVVQINFFIVVDLAKLERLQLILMFIERLLRSFGFSYVALSRNLLILSKHEIIKSLFIV